MALPLTLTVGVLPFLNETACGCLARQDRRGKGDLLAQRVSFLGCGLTILYCAHSVERVMKITAKVFKSGNSWAVRLPAALKPSAKELVINTNRDGDIILYDEKVREQAYQKRMQAWRELVATAPVESENEPVASFSRP